MGFEGHRDDISSYSDSENDKFECSFCGKSFTKREYLRNHELLHRKDRPFKCSLCDSAFVLKTRLQTHLLSVHKVMPYRCGQCDVGFAKKRDLVDHECAGMMRSETEKNVESENHEAVEDGMDISRHQDTASVNGQGSSAASNGIFNYPNRRDYASLRSKN